MQRRRPEGMQDACKDIGECSKHSHDAEVDCQSASISSQVMKMTTGKGSDTCVICGESIPQNRRMIAPGEDRCVPCLSQLEHNAKAVKLRPV